MINEVTHTDLSPFANHLWQSSLCVVLVWFLTLTLENNRAAVRYWLWLAASVKFLVPFSLLVSLGGRLEWRTAPTAPIAPKWSSVVENVSSPFIASTPTLKDAVSSFRDFLPTILLVAWLCGFAVSIILWIRCWRRMRVARKRAVPLFFRLPIPVMLSPVLMEPGVLGIRRPALLLPNNIMDRLTPAQLNAVLAHEMCHVRRQDNLTAAIHMLVEAVFWFYPLVWWIRWRLIEERERSCDEEVLQLGSDAEVYAESILNVCKLYVQYPSPWVSGISGADLKRRIVQIMTQRLLEDLSLARKLFLAAIGIGAFVGPVLIGVIDAPAQSQMSSWQTGKQLTFEVASVRQHKPGDDASSMNVPTGPGDESPHLGDLYRGVNLRLVSYIYFAYKLTGSQLQLLMPQLSKLPEWVNADRFDIEARADGNPTKDQMRLMMQSLLADRFKLAIHYETQQRPVFALALAKPGKIGPNLRPHLDTPPCSTADPHTDPKPDQKSTVPGGFPVVCSVIVGMAGRGPGQLRAGARDVSIGLLASTLAQMGNLDRPVVDRTGLSGTIDFVFEWSPQRDALAAPGSDARVDDPGPTFVEDLKEQLGLKLESQKGPVEVFMIDHVEKPSEN